MKEIFEAEKAYKTLIDKMKSESASRTTESELNEVELAKLRCSNSELQARLVEFEARKQKELEAFNREQKELEYNLEKVKKETANERVRLEKKLGEGEERLSACISQIGQKDIETQSIQVSWKNKTYHK